MNKITCQIYRTALGTGTRPQRNPTVPSKKVIHTRGRGTASCCISRLLKTKENLEKTLFFIQNPSTTPKVPEDQRQHPVTRLECRSASFGVWELLKIKFATRASPNGL